MRIQLAVFLLLAHTALAVEPGVRLTIPRTTHPPALDGKLAPGEWDDAAAVTGVINQFDGVAHPRQATFWLKFDEKNVFVAQRSTLLPGEKNVPAATLPWHSLWGLNMAFDRMIGPELMPPLYFKDNQNTVVIALAPNRVNSGDTPSWYRYMANITSTNLVRKELFDQIKGVKLAAISVDADALAVRHIPNTTQATNSFNADGTVWESEYVIPLAAMNVEKLPVGEEWGILLARDYPQQEQNAIVAGQSYRFDYVLRAWRNLALMSAYDRDKQYARVRLADSVPVLQVLELGNFLDGRVQPKLAISNSTTQATAVTVKVAVGAKTQEQQIALAPGERKEWTANEIVASSGTLQLSVKDAAGTALYEQAVPFRAGYGRDRTTYVPDLWMSGEPKVCAGQVCVLNEYNPISNTLWVKLKLASNRPSEDKRTGAELTVRRQGEEKPFVSYPFSNKPQGVGDYELKTKLPELQPGVYEITASLYADGDKPRDMGAAMMNAANLNPTPDRKLLARSRSLFIRYDHAKELPWIGNKIGVTDQVLPPWTPIETKKTKTGLDLSCWGRTYSVDGSGLFTQVRSLDEDILSGPVRIELTQDGKVVPLKTAKKLSNVHAAKNEVKFEGALQSDKWKIATAGHLEYDGYLEYRIRFEPVGEQKVDKVQFIIPVTEAEGRYLHAAASPGSGSMRWMRTTDRLKSGPGQLWNSGEQCGGPSQNGSGLVIGNLKNYVWVGGVKRGISFMADNDKDWVPDETKQVSNIEVMRTATGVNLVLNLVTRPFTFTHAREITFSLQATPLKPLPDDFRFERYHVRLLSAFVGFDPDGWAWNGCQLTLTNECYLCGQSSSQHPLNWKRDVDWNTVGWQRTCPWQTNAVLTQYQAMNSVFQVPEVDDPHVPAMHGANLYGYIMPEITAQYDAYDSALSQTEVEYRAWRYQLWIHGAHVQGWYFDNSFSALGANPDAGIGYVIDLPDRPNLNGKIQPGYAWRGIREMLKRLRAINVAEGIRPAIGLHATDTYMMGAYSFADFLLDGENGPMVGTNGVWFSEKWSPEYMQTLNDSAKWGMGTFMLDMFAGIPPVTVVRDYLGYLQLHDNEASSWEYTDWRGIDIKRKADFLPYWDEKVAAALATGQTNVFASAWRQDNHLMVNIFNRSAGPQTNLTVVIDPAALGIAGSNGFVVSDLQTKKADATEATWLSDFNNPGVTNLSFRSDSKLIHIMLDVRPHDYRLLRIERTSP